MLLRLLSQRVGTTAVHRGAFAARSFSTRYTQDHEWISVSARRPDPVCLPRPHVSLTRTPLLQLAQFADGVGTIGISDFAQNALGDVVYVDLPDVGDSLDKGEAFGSVESVKAASDVYMPVGGEVVEVNESLEDDPSLVNSGPQDDGWFIRVKVADEGELDALLDEGAYESHCEAEDH